jgi:glutamate-1-semialdehyde 2,1-aminomutase
MKTTALIQARMGSSRLPGKILKEIGGQSVLFWVTRAAGAIPGVDDVIVATTDGTSDDIVEQWCLEHDVACHRGSENDVLTRFTDIVRARDPDIVLRLTADCPMLDPEVCGQVLALLRLSGADYATNTDPRRWPDGLDCEAICVDALLDADRTVTSPDDREHVLQFVRHAQSRYKVVSLPCPIPGVGSQRWTLDTQNDLEFLNELVRHLPSLDRPPSFAELLVAAERAGSLAPASRDEKNRAERYAETGQSKNSASRYSASQAALRRALKTVPLGTQTFSKAYTQMPDGAAPLFVSHGREGRIWDVDGNRYVDLVCGLLPVVLGYCDPDVDAAVQSQLMRGVSFSLATELEAELAERLVDIIPCAEKVRYGKNGTDATSATIRLARAFTGHDRIAVCGYHGWQDWYIGSTTRNKGVPKAVQELTHKFSFNDLDELHRLFAAYPGEFAAVILEPITDTEPREGYFEELKALAHRHGALLIFDEIITGFRFDLGGAQKLFGTTPDLASFGKSMGNGLPISAVVGRADVMAEMEEVFFSGTFGGEALSLAAAIAVIDKMRREPVIETLWKNGRRLAESVAAEINAFHLGDVVSLKGAAPWKLVSLKDHPKASVAAIRTLFNKEMLANGVLVGGSHNICYAHNDADLGAVAAAYRRTLSTIAEELDTGMLEERLGIPPIEPVFAVRKV